MTLTSLKKRGILEIPPSFYFRYIRELYNYENRSVFHPWISVLVAQLF